MPMVARPTTLATLRRHLHDVQGGLTAVSLTGEAGIGKTFLLDAAIDDARTDGLTVLSTRCTPSELGLAFASLTDLLGPVDGTAFAALPSHQRLALEIALLKVAPTGLPVDARMIGTAVAGVLRDLSVRAPVLIAVDDLPRLDASTARALHFALRRLPEAAIALLGTIRSGECGGVIDPVEAVPPHRRHEMTLGPLTERALLTLTREALRAGVSRQTMRRVVADAHGNPLCAIELARALGGTDPAPDEALPVPQRVANLFSSRVGRLPPATRRALLQLAAAARPGIDIVDQGDLEPAERAGLIAVTAGGAVTLQHPLLAAALYARARPIERREVHAWLAERVANPEERARHLALAVAGSDAAVAATLVEAVRHAHRRGAPDAAAALAELAARLTPDPPGRGRLLVRAARLHLQAGDPLRAEEIVHRALSLVGDSAARAEALRLGAELSAYREGGLDAALTLTGEAIDVATAAADLALRAELRTQYSSLLAAAMRWAESHTELGLALDDARSTGDQALAAKITVFRIGMGAILGTAADRSALDRALALDDPGRVLPSLIQAPVLAALALLWSDQAGEACARLAGAVEEAAGQGADAVETIIAAELAVASWWAGHLDDAGRWARRAGALAGRSGLDVYAVRAAWLSGLLAAHRGESEQALTAAGTALATAQRLNWRLGALEAHGAGGVVHLLAGDPGAALTCFEPVLDAVEQLGLHHHVVAASVPDAIEALVSAGHLERAERHARALVAFGERSGYAWHRAVGPRSLAVVLSARGDLAAALTAATQAVTARVQNPLEAARTLLVLGRTQRRVGERRAARASLGAARTSLAALGLAPWVARAEADLSRVATRRAPSTLTQTESQVAALAAAGLSNPQIASRLFISRRTVEANLTRIYRKLGISGRAELPAGREPDRPDG